MAQGRFVARLRSFWLAPLLVLAVVVLGTFTLRTTLALDRLRQQTVLEATLGLATEKAARLDRQIVDQDNVVLAIADPARPADLFERWLPTAQRETPSVRAVLVLDGHSNVVAFVSRAGGRLADEEAFRRVLVHRMLGELEASRPEELRHLHRDYGGQSYLVSYWRREHAGQRFLVFAWHDIGRIVKDTLPTLYGDAHGGPARVNVVDEQGRIIFGPPLGRGEFTVSVRFPTTLYGWRVQVSPAAAEELVRRAEGRRLFETATVVLACVVVVAGAFGLLWLVDRERRVATLKSDFVANVSHELKTPLALVRMFAEMLQTGRVASDDKRREYLDIIVRESERLSALIENVLDFARLERGRDAYDLVEGDVGDVVEKAVSTATYRAERAGTRLVTEIADDLPRVRIDERAVALAVGNLIDNALKYAPGGEQVVVRARPDGSTVRVEVEDRGPGVPIDERVRIFERFVRGEVHAGAGGEAPRGSGIGLALVKHVVESHGGRVWVEDAAGGGARFLFTLPGGVFAASVPRTRAAAPAPPEDAPPRGLG